MYSEKVPVVAHNNRRVQSTVRVYSEDWEPLADVDMSTGERLSVQWPCRLEFISVSGMPETRCVSYTQGDYSCDLYYGIEGNSH
jgi:hypothetical protein